MKARIPKRSLKELTIDSIRKDIADGKTFATVALLYDFDAEEFLIHLRKVFTPSEVSEICRGFVELAEKAKSGPSKPGRLPAKVAAESNPVKPLPKMKQIHILPFGADSDTMMTVNIKSPDGEDIPDSVVQQLQERIHHVIDESAREFAEKRAARSQKFIQDTIDLHYEERAFEEQLSEHLDEEEATLIASGEETIRGLEKILKNSKHRLSKIYSQTSDLNLKKSDLQERIERAEDKLRRLRHSITSTSAEIAETEDKLDRRPKGSELRKLESKLVLLTDEFEKLKSDEARTVARLDKRRAELALTIETLAGLEAEKKGLEEVVESSTKEIQEIRNDLAEFCLPQVFVKRCSCGVVAVFRHFDESDDDILKEVENGKVWSDRIAKYLHDSDKEVPDTERVLAIKILVRIGKLKPSQYVVRWGNCTDDVHELVQVFCRK